MKKLPATLEGDKTAERLKKNFAEMLDTMAQVEARRREATSVDSPDYSAAFRAVVASSRRQVARDIGLDLIGLLAAGLISYAINVMTGSGNPTAIALALIGGIPLAGVAVFFKYIRS